MTTELVTTNKPLWNEDDIRLIREMCAPKAVTDSEFKVFLYIAGKYGLDPLTKEIYIQKFYNKGKGEWNPATIFVSYNGMVKTADRTGLLDGCYPECIYGPDGKLTGARSTVWKKGCSHPFVAEVDFEEYAAPDRNPMWKAANAGGKPKTMIKKVANVHALRMAFSLSDVYIEEEFDKAVEEPRTPPAKQLPAQEVDTATGEVIEATPARLEVINNIRTLAKQKNVTERGLQTRCQQLYGKALDFLADEQLAELLQKIEAAPAAEKAGR